MKLFITAKPNAKQRKIEKIDETHFRVSVKEAAKNGRANEAVVEALSEYFDIPKSRFEILSGHQSKTKVIEFR